MSEPLEDKIRTVINSVSAENVSDTLDFILARYLVGCLDVFNAAVISRGKWYHHEQPEVEEPISE